MSNPEYSIGNFFFAFLTEMGYIEIDDRVEYGFVRGIAKKSFWGVPKKAYVHMVMNPDCKTIDGVWFEKRRSEYYKHNREDDEDAWDSDEDCDDFESKYGNKFTKVLDPKKW